MDENVEKNKIFKTIIERGMVPAGFFSNQKTLNYTDKLMRDRLFESVSALWKMGFEDYAGVVFMLKFIWFPAKMVKLPHFHSQGPQILAQKKGIMSYYCTYLIDEKQKRIDDENANLLSYPFAAVAVGTRKGCEALPLLKKTVTVKDLAKLKVNLVKNNGSWYLKQNKPEGNNNAVWSAHSAQKWETCAGNRMIRHYFAEALGSFGVEFTENDFPEIEPSPGESRSKSWGENKASSVEPLDTEIPPENQDQSPPILDEGPPIYEYKRGGPHHRDKISEDPPKSENKRDRFDDWGL